MIESAANVVKIAKMNVEQFKDEIRIAENEFKRSIENYTLGQVTKGIKVTPSYLNINIQDIEKIARASEFLHQLIEKIFNALAQGDEKLRSHFKQHWKFFEFLVKPREMWQFYGRFDFLINNKGYFKFCETNTSGGAGFWLNHYYNHISQSIMDSLNITNDDYRVHQAYENFTYFAKIAIKTETELGHAPGLIAILHDDSNIIDKSSQISAELYMLKHSFEQCGREVIVTDIRNLTYEKGALLFQNKKISMTFNKFRLAGWSGRWGENFKHEYSAFMSALLDKAFFPINEVNSLVIGEDKGIFAVFTDPNFNYLFNADEVEFINTYILWTRRLDKNNEKLMEYAIENKENLIAKPSNDRRGYGVVSGEACTCEEWFNIINQYAQAEAVIQEKFDCIKIPTVVLVKDELEYKHCFHTGSSFMINGKFSGLLSRLSDKFISNISNGGMTQPIRIFNPAYSKTHSHHVGIKEIEGQ